MDAPATAPAADMSDLAAEAAAIVAAASHGVPEPAHPPDRTQVLTPAQRAILDFERHWWRRPGAKEQAIRESFEMSTTRYYQTLNALLDLPEALAYDPTLVNRLQRLRGATLRTRRLA